MEVYEAVRTLLAVRSYQDEVVPHKTIERILDAGRLTGSSRNTQQWDFIVITEKATLRRLGVLARSGSYLGGAPLAIAVVVPAAGTTGLIDGARAIQDMMLVAWDQGIGSNWVGNVNTVEIRDLLAVPSDRQVLAIVPFGYPDRKLGKGKKNRKSISEIAHHEKYGKAYTS